MEPNEGAPWAYIGGYHNTVLILWGAFTRAKFLFSDEDAYYQNDPAHEQTTYQTLRTFQGLRSELRIMVMPASGSRSLAYPQPDRIVESVLSGDPAVGSALSEIGHRLSKAG